MSQYNEVSILRKYFGDNNMTISENGQPIKRTVVEIGAAFHDTNSNSKYLIDSGWRALLIEPNRFFFNDLLKAHQNNPDVYLENCCAHTHDIEEVIFYEYGQYSTMSLDFKKRVENIGESKESWIDHLGQTQIGFLENRVKAFKTSKIIEKYFNYVDFLSVDCEGVDFDVIKGIDFDKVHIQLICHERQNEVEINREIESYLSLYGYVFYTANTGNIFYEKKSK